jgi:hypothetical protein
MRSELWGQSDDSSQLSSSFLLVFLFWTAGIARADAIFDFNSDPVGSDFYGPSTTSSNTSKGLTATFSSPAFPGGFAVA